MIDLLEGQGKLELWENPPKQFDVRYAFEIEIRYPKRPGFPRARLQSYPVGKIVAINGEILKEGIYRLRPSNSEILKVQKSNSITGSFFGGFLAQCSAIGLTSRAKSPQGGLSIGSRRNGVEPVGS
jgi:hypothetical protein